MLFDNLLLDLIILFERPEKIQITIEFNPKSNTLESFVIYKEGKEKAYVFY